MSLRPFQASFPWSKWIIDVIPVCDPTAALLGFGTFPIGSSWFEIVPVWDRLRRRNRLRVAFAGIGQASKGLNVYRCAVL